MRYFVALLTSCRKYFSSRARDLVSIQNRDLEGLVVRHAWGTRVEWQGSLWRDGMKESRTEPGNHLTFHKRGRGEISKAFRRNLRFQVRPPEEGRPPKMRGKEADDCSSYACRNVLFFCSFIMSHFEKGWRVYTWKTDGRYPLVWLESASRGDWYNDGRGLGGFAFISPWNSQSLQGSCRANMDSPCRYVVILFCVWLSYILLCWAWTTIQDKHAIHSPADETAVFRWTSSYKNRVKYNFID